MNDQCGFFNSQTENYFNIIYIQILLSQRGLLLSTKKMKEIYVFEKSL